MYRNILSNNDWTPNGLTAFNTDYSRAFEVEGKGVRYRVNDEEDRVLVIDTMLVDRDRYQCTF